MRVEELAVFFSQLERETSRNKITQILAELFKKAGKEEVDKICYLALGQLGPSFEKVEFGIAEKTMVKILAQAYFKTEEKVREEYKKVGDLGKVAEKFAKRRKPKKIEIKGIYQKLLEIAKEEGEGSVERKINKMANLLSILDSQSARFIARIPVGKLRLGFSELTILDSLSFMRVGDKSKRKEIEEAYNVRADIGFIAKLVKTSGFKKLKKISVSLGTPVMPALCQRLPNASEMIKKMGKVAVEPKFDGQRLQVHFSKKKKWQEDEKQQAFDFKPKGFVSSFTRNLENTVYMFPDLVKSVFKEVKAQEAILDCEAIGYNPKNGKFLPFQETIKRKRKYEVGKTAKEVPLKFFCFDILLKDGKQLLKMPFSKRRKILEKILPKKNKTIILSPQIVTDDPEELRAYHDEQIKKGLEGVVVKRWEGVYEPGRRGYNWVKFKQEETKKGGGLSDTIDCLVMGYYRGRGKRAEFGIGAFLVGVGKDDQFLSVSKIGTGLSDKMWREMEKRCSEIKVDKPPKQYKVDKNLTPDVWCQPSLIVEIQADNITRSPVHTAGMALRFPRLVRFRDEKKPSQVTSLKELKKLYKLQK